MERDSQRGGIRGTSIACQALLPGRWCWRGSEDEDDRFAAYDFQPLSSDVTAWPVFPYHWSKRERGRSVFKRRMGSRVRGRERPEHRTDPPRLHAGTAFLTLRAQGTASTMADARGIQHPKRAVAFQPALLRVQRVISGTAQCPIGLWGKSGTGKAPCKRRTCPLGRTIWDLWRLLLQAYRLDGGSGLNGRLDGGDSHPDLVTIWLGVNDLARRASAPVPDGGSTPIARGFGKTPGRRGYGSTTDPRSALDPRRRAPFQMTLDADTDQAHPRARMPEKGYCIPL